MFAILYSAEVVIDNMQMSIWAQKRVFFLLFSLCFCIYLFILGYCVSMCMHAHLCPCTTIVCIHQKTTWWSELSPSTVSSELKSSGLEASLYTLAFHLLPQQTILVSDGGNGTCDSQIYRQFAPRTLKEFLPLSCQKLGEGLGNGSGAAQV